MYMNRTRGFSLLEITITLAVLGILTAVAAAGFREYVVRAAVAEGFAFADAARTSVIESLSLGTTPSSVSMSSGGVAGHRTSVDWHVAGRDGLEGYLLASAELPMTGLKKTFALELRQGGSWYCVDAAPYAPAGEALAPRFLPALCRGGGTLPSAPPRAAGCGPDEDPLSISASGGASVAACAPKCPAGHSRVPGGGAVCQPDPVPVAGATAAVAPSASPSASAVSAAPAPAAPASPAAPACPAGQFPEMDHQTGLPTGNCRDWNYGGSGWQAPALDSPCDLGGAIPAPKDAVYQAMTCDPVSDPGICAALPPDPATDPAWAKACNPGELPFARVTNGGTGNQELARGCMSRSDCASYKNDLSDESCQKHSMTRTATEDYTCTYCCVGDGCNGGDPAGGGCPVKPGTLILYED